MVSFEVEEKSVYCPDRDIVSKCNLDRGVLVGFYDDQSDKYVVGKICTIGQAYGLVKDLLVKAYFLGITDQKCFLVCHKPKFLSLLWLRKKLVELNLKSWGISITSEDSGRKQGNKALISFERGCPVVDIMGKPVIKEVKSE